MGVSSSPDEVAATQLLRDRWRQEEGYLLGRERSRLASYFFQWVSENGSRNGLHWYNPHSLTEHELDRRCHTHWDAARKFIEECWTATTLPVEICVEGKIQVELIEQAWKIVLPLFVDAPLQQVTCLKDASVA
jgi:hypothetical protein